MNPFSKRLLALLGSVIGFGVAASAFTLVVEYKPYGVPDARRADYEAKVEELRLRDRLLKEPPQEKLPIAFIAKRSHNFGMIDPHSVSSHSFEVRNDGLAPLALQIGKTSCKCTAGDLTDGLLQPSESTLVTLTWNTGYQEDHYEQTVNLITNDPTAKSIELKVLGQVRAELITPDCITFPKTDPGQTTSASFIVFSQLWDDFSILDLTCDVEGFEWAAEPIEHSDTRLIDKDPRSAWEIRMLATPMSTGNFSGNIDLTIRACNGIDELTRRLQYSGKARPPISFYSPEIHVSDGLDIGTLVAGNPHQFHVVVRVRNEEKRKVQVLDIQPPELKASLSPISIEGSYRLTIEVPSDCGTTVFNTSEKHGYIQIGDPDDRKQFSNWFPIKGAIVELDD